MAFVISVNRNVPFKYGMVPSQSKTTNKGINVRFTPRGQYMISFDNSESNNSINFQSFAMDGREEKPSTLLTMQQGRLSTFKTQQSTFELICFVCSHLEQVSSPPVSNSQVTNSCWNPSSRDMKTQSCHASNGLCKTKTFQYATSHGNRLKSFWVGVERGCVNDQEDKRTGELALEDSAPVVRYYPASNSISKVTTIFRVLIAC